MKEGATVYHKVDGRRMVVTHFIKAGNIKHGTRDLIMCRFLTESDEYKLQRFTVDEVEEREDV